MTNNRESLIRKIRALQSKTTDNGCTEGEAMAAAAKIAALMAEYDLTLTDVELGASSCEKSTFRAPNPDHPIGTCASAIAYLCDVRVWVAHDWDWSKVRQDLFGERIGSPERVHDITYFGLPHDVEVAKYLTDICWRAMQGGTGRLAQAKGRNVTQQQVYAFQAGMARAMAETLRDMKPSRQERGNGRDIVAMKSELVEREFRKLGLHLTKRHGKRYSGEDFAAGAEAGGRVRFNPGVTQGGSNATLAIGSR